MMNDLSINLMRKHYKEALRASNKAQLDSINKASKAVLHDRMIADGLQLDTFRVSRKTIPTDDKESIELTQAQPVVEMTEPPKKIVRRAPVKKAG